MSLLDGLKGLALGSGVTSAQRGEDPDASTLWTTPWEWRTGDGIYVGHNSQVWLYRVLPLAPARWEDANTRLSHGRELDNLLNDLGQLSSAPVGGLRTLSNNRKIHILSITWDVPAEPPAGTPAGLREYLENTLGFLVPQRALFIGVRLRASTSPTSKQGGIADLAQGLTKAATKVLAEDVPDIASYDKDAALISGIISKYGGTLPTRTELNQLESWYNSGRGPDVSIVEKERTLKIGPYEELELSAVMRFNNMSMSSPNSQWVLDASTHFEDAPHVISVRAELEPATTTRARARRSQRRVREAMREEAETGDLERVENSQVFQAAKAFEDSIAGGSEPILTNCSMILVRKTSDANETYIDFLRTAYGIELKPLEHRQMPALEETLPCSGKLLNPFLQDVTVPMLAYSGIHGFSALGDDKGVYLGLADPDLVPTYLNPLGAPAADKPPAMVVVGEPGSGKSFLCQSLALQSALGGLPTMFINPKPMDDLTGSVELANLAGVPATSVKMSALESEPGAFDPFRYAPPRVAAEIATQHILAVLGQGWEQHEELSLGSAMREAADAGVSCVGEALAFVKHERVVTEIKQQMEASAAFSLGIALTARPKFSVSERYTLISFDRKLDLPDASKRPSDYSRSEKIALAAMRLVTRACLEILVNAGGGVLVVDEAWTFLSHPEGLAALQQLGREGRSMNILPIFATQRIADVLTNDLESYLSRVIVMQMKDPREAKAALELLGLRPTEARMEWLRTAGPRRSKNGQPSRWALALHRDLDGRHSAVCLGPVPPAVMSAFSTNPEDRKQRAAARAAASTLGLTKSTGDPGETP